MPNKTFIIGFVSGALFTLVISLVVFGAFSTNTDVPSNSVGLQAASRSMDSNNHISGLVPATNLDSRDGLSEVEKMRYALEKIVSELDTIGDRIYNLERPLGKIADNMR